MISNDIFNTIMAHADKEGGGRHNWYCGITSDPWRRLFDEHNVPREGHLARWIYDNAEFEQYARDIESALLRAGFDGGSGGGDSTTVYVYAYKKISGVTIENN